jgi:hypothetical protein
MSLEKAFNSSFRHSLGICATNTVSIKPNLVANLHTMDEYSISPFFRLVKIFTQWSNMNCTSETFTRLIIQSINFKSSILAEQMSSCGKRVMPSHICMKHKTGSCMELVWGWSHLSSFEISFQKLGLTNSGITVSTSIIHCSLKP